MVSLPDSDFVKQALEKLDFFVSIDFFLNDTARYADIVLPGSLHEEDEGTVTQVEGRVIKINKAVECPGDAKQDWKIIQDIAQALGREKGFTFQEPREMWDELRVASKGGICDYSGISGLSFEGFLKIGHGLLKQFNGALVLVGPKIYVGNLSSKQRFLAQIILLLSTSQSLLSIFQCFLVIST